MFTLTLSEHLSRREVEAATGLPRSTVSEYVKRAERAGLTWPLPQELDDGALEALLFPPPRPASDRRPQPAWGEVAKELRRKGVTLELLWHEYREVHPDGYGYSQFCHLFRAWQAKTDVVMRQDHRAGEKAFCDFSGLRLPIYDARTAAVAFDAELYVCCLGASSFTYAEAVRSQGLADWIGASVHAVEYFGGAPAIWVPDNLRSAVTTANRYEPLVNVTFDEFAAHYAMAVIPARPYKPRDKAKVEAAVLMAQRWILAVLRTQRFTSLAAANAAIAECLERLNDKPFKKLAGSRRSLYEALDRPALRPLPHDPYRYGRFKHARAGIDYHVEVERHYYSVPYQLATRQLLVRIGESSVEVFSQSKRVASHLRSHSPGHTTDPAHMPESHRRHAEWTPERIIAWAAATGPNCARVVEGILARRRHPEQGYRSCLGIIRLAKRYGADRLEAACGRALHYRAFSYRSIDSMLVHGLDHQPLPTNEPVRAHPRHRNLRGADYYR